MFGLLLKFVQYVHDKLVHATGGGFHWPEFFHWPPVSDISDTTHHDVQHDEQLKTSPFDHIHDLHL